MMVAQIEYHLPTFIETHSYQTILSPLQDLIFIEMIQKSRLFQYVQSFVVLLQNTHLNQYLLVTIETQIFLKVSPTILKQNTWHFFNCWDN